MRHEHLHLDGEIDKCFHQNTVGDIENITYGFYEDPKKDAFATLFGIMLMKDKKIKKEGGL